MLDRPFLLFMVLQETFRHKKYMGSARSRPELFVIPPLRKHVFSTENDKKLAFPDPPPPYKWLYMNGPLCFWLFDFISAIFRLFLSNLANVNFG